jgi:N-methylhydantoinase B
LITNDIWLGTGHLPDITVAKPIFHLGKIVGFAGSVAHSPDIGGRIRSPDARDVYEEGLQIPIMKAMSAGKIDPTLERILRKNVRVPDQVMGDLYAQFTALTLMEHRVMALLKEQKLKSLADLGREIHSRSEKAMRAAIRKVPNGVYRQSALSDGITDPIKLEMALTVKGRVDRSRLRRYCTASHARHQRLYGVYDCVYVVRRQIGACAAYSQ